MWKIVFVVSAIPVSCGLVFLFLKIRFGLIKDEAERLEKWRKWFGD